MGSNCRLSGRVQSSRRGIDSQDKSTAWQLSVLRKGSLQQQRYVIMSYEWQQAQLSSRWVPGTLKNPASAVTLPVGPNHLAFLMEGCRTQESNELGSFTFARQSYSPGLTYCVMGYNKYEPNLSVPLVFSDLIWLIPNICSQTSVFFTRGERLAHARLSISLFVDRALARASRASVHYARAGTKLFPDAPAPTPTKKKKNTWQQAWNIQSYAFFCFTSTWLIQKCSNPAWVKSHYISLGHRHIYLWYTQIYLLNFQLIYK